MSKKINRRKFITNTSLSATGVILGSNIVGCLSRKEQGISSYHIMNDVMKYRKIDAHAHPDTDLRKQLDIADSLGINKLQISMPITNFSGNDPEGPEQVRKNNDIILKL